MKKGKKSYFAPQNVKKVFQIWTRMRGKMLDDSDINKMIRQGKHFGVYDTKKELDRADSTIHDYFRSL